VPELFSRIKQAGRAPTAEERLLDIVELHEARPGITEATLGAWKTSSGLTGYDLLVERVPPRARVVVELGAGNGPLLERLLRERPALERAIGVDLCAADLELARARLDRRAELHRTRADRLPIAAGSADAVLTHHALYLFDPPEPAIREIARVLRPGGLFATAHWTFRKRSESLFWQMMDVMAARNRRDAPHFTGWADPRMLDRDELEALLASEGLAGLEIEEHTLEIREPGELVCDRLMGFFYSVELQRPETRAELRREWLRILASSDTLSFPFSIVSAVRGGLPETLEPAAGRV
jgi:SAM-dependent methyltransferase